MYGPNYGFGQGAPNFNNAAPQQQGMQQAQQMMFNQQQQFANMAAPQAAFAQGGNPQMMTGAHPGIMQNPGMAMGPNGQMAGFPQQFQQGPYGQVMPQNPQQNAYMMQAGMQGFPMNQVGGMQQQQQQQMMQLMQQQRAAQQQHQQQQQAQQQQQQQHQHQQHQPQPQQPQPPHQQQPTPQPQPQMQHQQQPPQPQQSPMNQHMSHASTPQRPPSHQGTPVSQMQAQQNQFPTPQPPQQIQTQNNPQQQQMNQSAPQTPTFPQKQGANAPGPMPAATPLSPQSASREKERFSLLLDINHELLYESIQIQQTQAELKKNNGGKEDNSNPEEKALLQDYMQCMKRLQANLTYMAAVADRKPNVKVPPFPTIMSAPALNLGLTLKAPAVLEGMQQPFDPQADRQQRDGSMKELYHRLQAVFPGVDPSRMAQQGGAQRSGQPGMNQSPTVQQAPQMPNMQPPPPNQMMV